MSRRRARVLAAGLLAASAGACASALTTASALAPTALLPPQLQALEQKMEQLQFNSERFSEVTRGFVLGSPNNVSGGKPEHLVRTSLNATELGEASVSPAEGEVFVGAGHRPVLIAIGSTLYQYEPRGKRSHRHRPWVRSRNPRESPATQILPFLGGGPLEVNAGGTGSFAGLINLLTTRVGPVSVNGPALVQGQQTTEFTAIVEPRLLIKGLTVEDVARFKAEPPIQRLQIFLTESGLPIRVVTTTRSRDIKASATMEILAVNVPFTVKPPPAWETIAASR